ncbi:FAD-dependent oxidoreductase, possible FAD-dependent cmnm(5)s(2)U34 oxidoreductase [Malaciobacter molluscorum LMG 25693]|uniref:FAD-dependent oxidoreductase, possible FAD-dependent cmnm(5)s(2)U34 oxidoreductase n=1 Tax=Malaciobacter molluscorum LMG 25693 TaxID=870501 RepID=A0AB33GN27_9BACT|nr:FAD-dependent oxidoreductase [Malaciobacter molluscorum]AXX92616.1 FAD-dependent oxidoreductase, possible FAD-dependent cmnm(5)s(2)U34 oxidoreductase [Malaciobacter molluscorum LMG 25693]
MIKEYDYIIVGAGIAGCSVSYFLNKNSNSVLLIDKNSDLAMGASGAAGAFLSPLLGKPNNFKQLVSNSLTFSINFYKSFEENILNNCGVCRIPKDSEDKDKFQTYKTFMDFEYEKLTDGFYFKVGSIINPKDITTILTKNSETLFNYDINNIEKLEDEKWLLNGELKAKKLILTTGINTELIDEEYFSIRPVWGQKIDIETSTLTTMNYHKQCSISTVLEKKNDKNILSIGATHHRFENIQIKDINNTHEFYTKDIIEEDSNHLLTLANDIIKLENVNILDVKIGARACSTDYLPIVGKLVDSKKTIKEYPHLVNGSFINDDKLSFHDNLYVLNGVGGRGFVLSSYLAKMLVDNIIMNEPILNEVLPNRLFKRWVKKSKLNNC